ncbi:MAG: sigma-70 family RNA polymerase sigma factor [Petrimonas sp.]|nr:sigma-70 family RNA polymerase sigma factor [Petrimonas sp.]
MSEHRLISACKEGKLWARKEVYEQYAPAMMALCKRYVADGDDAKDVLQEGFLKIFTQMDQYSGSGPFGAWIRKIFVNTSLDFLRTKNRLKEKETRLLVETGYNENTPSVEQVTADDLMDCIAELPDAYRTVFNLFAIEGYRHQEIAAMLNIQESTSRSQFYRARQILQEKVTRLMQEKNAV